MAIFNRFPFSNAHELNLDWILQQLQDLLRRVKHLEESEGGGGGDPGTTNYNDLSNKPRINNVTLQGNKTTEDLNLPTVTTIRAEINHELQLYDPGQADYDPPYPAGSIGHAIENAAIDPEDIQDAVDAYLNDHPTLTGTFTNAAKNALLALLEKVAYIDGNGQLYWNSLRQELFSAAVVSISATFNQGGAVIYDTDSLDVLRQYLTVTATYSDSTTEEVYTYSLSGSLTPGTSTITVEYSGETTSFTVVVSAESWTWVYDPSIDGILTAQSYIYTGNMGTKTEEISNDLLHIVVPQTGSENNGYQIRFGNGGGGYNVTQGHLRMKVKFAGVCTLGSGTKANSFRINMSLAGTKGTKLIVIKEGSVYNLYRASTSGGSSVYNFIQTVQLDTWYIIDIKITSSGIVIELDGTSIYEGTNWATNTITYCGLYMVASAQSNSSLRENTEVYIEYIKLLSGGVN